MVAGGQYVRAQVEDLLGDLRRNAKAAGGVLDIDDDQIASRTCPICSRTILRPALPKMSPTKRMFKKQLLASSL